MKYARGMVAGLAVLLLAGCIGQGLIAPGGTAYQWTSGGGANRPGLGVERPATFVTEKCPSSKTCTKVIIGTSEPGQEAYSYTFKVKHRALIGIPYGEEPITVYVIGDREECLHHSAFHNVQPDGRVNEGNRRLSADPTERCTGPVWIR